MDKDNELTEYGHKERNIKINQSKNFEQKQNTDLEGDGLAGQKPERDEGAKNSVRAAENKMGVVPVGKLLFTMSFPAMISMMIQALYNIVDSIFVAMISEKALAAVTLVFPVQMLLASVGVGTGVGISSLISRRLGERRFKEANEAASHGFLIAAFNWILFAVFGLFFSASFVKLFSGDIEIVGMAVAYCGIVTVGSLFGFTQLSVERILQASGNMLFPMIFGIVGAVVNTALDPVLIFGLFGAPRMGVTGAALATVIGQALAMSVGLIMLFCFKHDVRVRLRGFRPRGRIIRDIYAVGAPSIAMMAMNSFAISGMNAILIRFSTAAVAVLGAYFRLQSLIFMPVFGLNQGALPIMGYNYGAKNRKRLLKTFRISVTTAVVIMAVGIVIFQIFPAQILGLFSASPEMMSVGTDALRIISLCFIPAGFIIVSSTLFQGLGHGMLSLLVTLLRQILLVLPLAWLLSTFFGLHYVWYAYPLAEVFTLALTILFVKRVYDKEIRRL